MGNRNARSRILPVSPGSAHILFQPIIETLEQIDPSDYVVHFGFAYVTVAGLQEFLRRFERVSNWAMFDKQVIVSVHHAITEPYALKTLRGLPRCEARIYLPHGRLTLPALADKSVFHAKTVAISSRSGLPISIHVGSANVTAAAIGRQPTNYELALSASSPLLGARDWQNWWGKAWRSSLAVDDRFIKRYGSLRQELLSRNPVIATVAEVPRTISRARFFFLDVGAASGPPGARHQVEFPAALARFFGPLRRGRRDLVLQKDGSIWAGRPLSFKRTSYGVEIWRLGMPTVATGGEPIAERAIRFERTDVPWRFTFKVTDVTTDQYAEWERLANLDGHLGQTRGERQRAYGFFG